MRTLALALVMALTWTSAGSARPWRVEDLFHVEDIGQAEFDPGGRFLLVERLRPRAEMTHFDMDNWGEIARRVPLVFDLMAGGPPRPLLSVNPDAGYALGSISPDGRRVAVYRLLDHSYTLGVVEVETGRIQWLGVTPELGRLGRALAWLSSTRIAVIIRPDDSLPLDFRMGFEAPEVLSRLSRAQAEGKEPSVIAVGSGRYLGLRPHAAPDELVTFDLESGAKRALAWGDFIDMAASYDQRFVALLSNGADIQYPDSKALSVGTPAFRRALSVVDLDSGRISEPTLGYDLLTHLLAWAPNSDRLLVYGRKGASAWADGQLLVVDALHDIIEPRPAIVAEVSGDRGAIPVVEADWDAGDPLLYGHAASEPAGRADWFRLRPARAQDLTSALPASPHLLAIGAAGLLFHAGNGFWRVDGDGRAARLQAPQNAAPIAPLPPDEGARFLFNNRPRRDWIWVRWGQGQTQTVQRLGDIEPLPLAIGRSDHVRATDDTGDRVLTIGRDAYGVLTLGLQGGERSPKALLRLNTNLVKIEPAVVRAVHHLSGSGSPVTSWLYLPPNVKPGERPPLLVSAYPGETYSAAPETQGPGLSDVPHAMANAQILAAQGYAVLVASLPPRPDLTDPADGFEPDILRAVDAAGATGLVDTSRLALWGHSYGGYAALEVATRTSRFAAIIASAAISDLVTVKSVFPPFTRLHPADGLWIDSSAGWLEDGQAQLHTQAWADPELYVRRSPVFSAGTITTPILLISGGMDPAAPDEQREEMFSDLYRQAKPAILATYFGEGHMIYSPANLMDVYARVFKFLGENLGSPPARSGS